ncbi:MAG: phosphoribosylformylglycinamidine synthase subunit PurS [Acidimicrobiales bacterium]
MTAETNWQVLIEVRLRPGIADPPAATVERSLPALGFDDVFGVSMGKAIRLRVSAPDAAGARARVVDLCDRFLTNPVMEEAVITVEAADATEAATPDP